MPKDTDSRLERCIRQLLQAFEASLAVQQGGPGGFAVMVDGETWNVGFSPGQTHFASNGISGVEVAQYRSFALIPPLTLLQNETATFVGRGYREDPNADRPVTSVAVVRWLIGLVKGADKVAKGGQWGGVADVPSLDDWIAGAVDATETIPDQGNEAS